MWHTTLQSMICHLYEPVFMAMPKLLLTEFGIHHSWEFFGWCKTRARKFIMWKASCHVSSQFSGNVCADRDT